MKGLRFYRSSVKADNKSGLLFFSHDKIDNKGSDFDYIFRPLYVRWAEKFLLNDQLFFLEDEDTGKFRDEIRDKIVWTGEEGHALVHASLLSLFGAEVQEFEGNELLILSSKPKKMDWNSYSQFTDANLDVVHCILHNWDGMYWEYFGQPDEYEILVKEHKGNSNLELYKVDFGNDYPEPTRPKSKLESA